VVAQRSTSLVRLRAPSSFALLRSGLDNAQLAAAVHSSATLWPSEIARITAFRGENDRAFEWLNRAYEARDEDLYLIKGDSPLRNLNGDARY